MSELSDKIAYIKGLCAGIDFSTDTPEGKLLMAIVDALGSVKDELDAVRDDHEELAEYVDVLDNDLEELEGEVYGDDEDYDEDDDDDEDDEDDDEDDDCDCGCDDEDDDCECGCHHHHNDHELSDALMDHPLAERPCPNCGKPITISMRALFKQDEPIVCPHCGGKFRAHEPEDEE